MRFNQIDLRTWKRKEYFEHYMNTVPCAYGLTVNIEVDGLADRVRSCGLKTYPVQIYLLTCVVNKFPEFRMALDDEGKPGYWEVSSPSYTIFNKATETFSSIHSAYDSDFNRFYERCRKDMEEFKDSETLFPQGDAPANIFHISSLPWLSFTGFSLNALGDGKYLAPIFTMGRYLEVDGKKQMPLSIQVHHAACDGWHIARFVSALQDMALSCDRWI